MSSEAQGYNSLVCFSFQSQKSESLSYNPTHSYFIHENKSNCVLPLAQKKSNTNSIKNEDEKSYIKNQLDLSELLLPQNRVIEKGAIVVKNYRSLIPDAISKKVKNKSAQITVFYFSTGKKIVFSQKAIKGWEIESEQKKPRLLKFLIPHLVKQYCKLYLNFEPLQVNYENFILKIAGLNGEDDPLVDHFSNEQQIDWLFDCGDLLLVRKERDYEGLKVWQKTLPAEMEALQIIIPFQRQITEQVQKNKALSSLKEKLIAHSQLGNIVIVTYNTFAVCEPKKKINEIVAIDRILEVYRLETSSYEDVDTHEGKQKMAALTKEPALAQNKDIRTVIDDEFEVSQNFYSGKLYLQILGTKIIEKYEGGFMGYLTSNERRHERSVYTLVGISCDKTKVNMKFMTKAGAETCLYEFQSKYKVEQFFKCIMKIGRQLKQNLEKIPN